MMARRLTDHDRRLGPFTWARCDGWKPLRLVLSSGGDDDEGRIDNTLTAYALGWVVRVSLPNLLQPYREKHIARSWDAATVVRLGRNWYYETHPREYGFSLHEGFLHVFLGAQTDDSTTTQDWCKHLPWTQWRFVRRSLFDLRGEHFWTEPTGLQVPGGAAWVEQQNMRDAVPKARFEVEDHDGQRILVSTFIEEREWRFGTGWFKWLSLFRAPRVSRSLDMHFDAEVGPEKGSWKGGLIGTGIDMLPGELHEAALRRYCDQEHRAKYGRYRITFVRVLCGLAQQERAPRLAGW